MSKPAQAPLLRVPGRLCAPNLLGGLSTRIGFPSVSEGDEASRKRSREILAGALGRSSSDMIWLRQVHSATVHRAERLPMDNAPLAEGDALVSDNPEHILLISVADCCPVLLWDPASTAFGAAHAGWRGLVGGVLANTVIELEELGAVRRRLRAWIGPSIGLDAFEVGDEVADRFDPSFVAPANGSSRVRPHVDLKRAAAGALIDAGLEKDHVEICADCTHTRADLYWSYRRDGGICGRHLAYLARST